MNYKLLYRPCSICSRITVLFGYLGFIVENSSQGFEISSNLFHHFIGSFIGQPIQFL